MQPGADLDILLGAGAVHDRGSTTGAARSSQEQTLTLYWEQGRCTTLAQICLAYLRDGVLHGYYVSVAFSNFLTICLVHLLFVDACMAHICLAHLLFAWTWGAPWIFVGITFLKTLSNTFYIR